MLRRPVALLAGATVPVAAAAVALACTNLATLHLSSEAVRPGDRITVVGTSFPVSRVADRPTTPVLLRWRTIDGPVLAEAVPDRTGVISVTVQIPESPAGYAMLVATQRRQLEAPGPDGTAPALFVDEVGTPARASLRVMAPGEPREQVTVAPPTNPGAVPGSNTTMLIVIVLFAAVALSLFGGGIIALLHQHRNLARPQAWPPR